MINIGIDASRNRSGGAKAHIIGILNDMEIDRHKIESVHIWVYSNLAKQLPVYPWLIIHTPPEIEGAIFKQLFWQRFLFPKALKANNIDILLSTDAGTLCRYKPYIVMSRDMLSYEKGEMNRYFISKSWLRLIILRFIQVSSMKKAKGVIFLTDYAKRVIEGRYGKFENVCVIPHGVSESFRNKPREYFDINNPKFIYVSNADKYKHQWHVVEAFYKFRQVTGKNATLTLVGADTGGSSNLVYDSIKKFDDGSNSVEVLGFLEHSKISEFLALHDFFVFASSCENMPNTLIEGMAAGLPIICSNRGPMPEVLKDAGVYFDPEKVLSILDAMLNITESFDAAKSRALLAYELSEQYSWKRCGDETMKYILETSELMRSRY